MFSRLRTSTAVIVSLMSVVSHVPKASAEGSMTLLLVSHCTEQTGCTEFAVSDATHFTTGQRVAGDILDLDVLVRGSEFADVRSVRSWISYNPAILEARSVEISAALPSPTPGEQTIDQSQGLVKIGGSTPSGFTTQDTRIARVTFRVLETTTDTELSFDGYNSAGNGKTAVNGEWNTHTANEKGIPEPPCFDAILGCKGSATPLLSGEPAKLTIKLATGKQSSASTASSVSSQGQNDVPLVITQTSSSFASSLSGQGSSFGLLQIQNVRVTTKDNAIFISWQALKSSELAGYNVYYGTISGRYLQRRSLPTTSTSLVLRDLEPGATYFLAVLGVNVQELESVFSQEVSVTVGKPESASSPMTTLPQNAGSVGKNPIDTRGGTTINGETGSANILAWILLSSALVGTGFAFRRQLVLPSHVS